MSDDRDTRERYALFLEQRASVVERTYAPDRLQAHSKRLTSEQEQVDATFAARQLRIAADDIRAGLIDAGVEAGA